MSTAIRRITALLFPQQPDVITLVTHDALIASFEDIVSVIAGKKDDPGKTYTIQYRVRRVVHSLIYEIDDHECYRDYEPETKPDEEQERQLEAIEDVISGLPNDPGPLYDIDERVRRVVGALQGKIGALESRGQR